MSYLCLLVKGELGRDKRRISCLPGFHELAAFEEQDSKQNSSKKGQEGYYKMVHPVLDTLRAACNRCLQRPLIASRYKYWYTRGHS